MTERDIRNIKCSHPSWEHLSLFYKERTWNMWRLSSDPLSDETFNGYITRNPTDTMVRIGREVSINGLID